MRETSLAIFEDFWSGRGKPTAESSSVMVDLTSSLKEVVGKMA